MQVKSGQSVTTEFPTQAPTTGAATNADSLPTGTLYVNGTADAAVVTVTNITTGRYKAAVTLPALAAGDMVAIWIVATVGGVTGGNKVWEASADTRYVSESVAQTGDSYARIGANGAGLTGVGDTSGTTTLLSRLSATRAGYLDNLSAGAVALASALSSAAADVTTLLSRLTSARAGYLDNLDAAVSSRSTYAGADTAGTTTLLARVPAAAALASDLATLATYVDTEVAAIKAKTDNLPGDPADQSAVEAAITAAQAALAALVSALNDIAAADVWTALDDASANKIADHVLRRSWATAAGSADGDALAFRSLLGAVAKLVNRVGISGATLTVYEDDDLTALGTQAVTSDADAEPITGVNTN